MCIDLILVDIFCDCFVFTGTLGVDGALRSYSFLKGRLGFMDPLNFIMRVFFVWSEKIFLFFLCCNAHF